MNSFKSRKEVDTILFKSEYFSKNGKQIDKAAQDLSKQTKATSLSY